MSAQVVLTDGAARDLDELYAAAGIEFRFDRELVGRLAERVAAAMVAEAAAA